MPFASQYTVGSQETSAAWEVRGKRLDPLGSAGESSTAPGVLRFYSERREMPRRTLRIASENGNLCCSTVVQFSANAARYLGALSDLRSFHRELHNKGR